MQTSPFIVSVIVPILLFTGCSMGPSSGPRWSIKNAQTWAEQAGWLVGCNFTPSTAINQIEFWQEDTFDPETIDRELGWAEGIGFNAIRVYLHYLVWARNPGALKQRMEKFLAIADSHDIKVMFVLFDDCWNENPTLGKQPDPIPGTHNSGWVQCPGGADQIQDEALYPVLEAYTKDIIAHFAHDDRVVVWDLYNEPGNFDHFNLTLPLLTKVFSWAREVNPSQPITSGLWSWGPRFKDLNELTVANSDIITFHHYNDAEDLEERVKEMNGYGRPVLCTEYMARTRECTFESHLPVFERENIGAFNWGLVSGKTQTIFMWDSVYAAEPEVWFHDIFRVDGAPYDPQEVALIRSLTLSQ
jgi:hypothetical protein